MAAVAWAGPVAVAVRHGERLADGAPHDAVWTLAAAALVLALAMPGFTLFHAGVAGMARPRSRLVNALVVSALAALHWALWGQHLALGTDRDASSWTAALPAHTIFQGALAILATALVAGVFEPGRRRVAVIVFALLWVTCVHDPLAHWLWADSGWLRRLGCLDFAGGGAVQIALAASALSCALLRGSCAGGSPVARHPSTMAIGALLSCGGALAISAGRAQAADEIAVAAFLATVLAIAGGVLGSLLNERLLGGGPSVRATACGAVAGLIAVAPAAGLVSPLAAIVIGALAGGLCSAIAAIAPRRGDRQALEITILHGVAGTWGMLAAGLFAGRVQIQLVAVLVSWAVGVAVTSVLVKVVEAVIGAAPADRAGGVTDGRAA